MKKHVQYPGLRLVGIALGLGLLAGCGPNKALVEKKNRLKAEAAALEKQRDSLPIQEQVKSEEAKSAELKQKIERSEEDIRAAKKSIAELEAALTVITPTHRIVQTDGKTLEGQAVHYADGTLLLSTGPQITEQVKVSEIDKMEFMGSR